MAISSSPAKLGNTGVSSLVKSASTIGNEINTYNDTLQSIQFENNPTEENLQSYLSYLNGRVTGLTSSGSITDMTKALNLQQSMNSAVSKSTSFQIQNESIQVMSGNATSTDKYNYIVSAYQRAAAIGDSTLSQSLESQAYSLSQQIQYEVQASADAAKTLATANAGEQQSVATNLNESLKQLNNDIKNSGQKDMNSTVQAWVKANTGALEAMGVKLPNGAQPNYFDLVNGVAGAIYNAHVLAYQAALPYSPQTAMTYLNQAMDLKNGVSTLPTLGGDLTSQEIQGAAANNAEYAYDQNSGKLIQTKQTGYSGYDQNGNPVPTYSGNTKQTTFLTPQQTTLMNKLGLQFSNNAPNATQKANGTTGVGNGVEVEATNTTPAWLQKVLGPNGVSNIYSTDQGLVFEADGQDGGKSYYTVAQDSKGLVGLYENTADKGVQALGGEYGFNQGANSVVNLINNSQATIQGIKLQQQANIDKLTAATPKPIPNVAVTPPPATQAAPAPIQAPSTVSIQGSQANPQGNNAGGTSINNSGGKGITITGTSNGNPGAIKL